MPQTLGDLSGQIRAAPRHGSLANRTSSAQRLARRGGDYEPRLKQRVVVEDGGGRFNPAWTKETPGSDKLACAVYGFSLLGYSAGKALTLGWDEAPEDYGNLLVGLSNWSANRWGWYPGPATGVFELDDSICADCVDPGTGEILVAVVLLGTEPALLRTLSAAEDHSGPWPMFGHDPQGTRQSPFVGAQTAELKWKFRTTGTGLWIGDSLVAHDGTIYVGVGSELHALNPGGSLIWRSAEAFSPITRPALGADGTLYVSDLYGKLHALNADGTIRWSYEVGGGSESNPVVGTDGTIYIGSQDSRLYAINPDGNLQWTCDAGNSNERSPAIGSDGTIYVGKAAINPDGTQKWMNTSGNRVKSSSTIGPDGTIYFGSCEGYDDGLYAVNPDGTEKWYFETGFWVESSAAVGADGSVYLGCRDSYVYALNPDGSLLWSCQTGAGIKSSPAIGADGTVYVGSDDGQLYAFGPGPGN